MYKHGTMKQDVGPYPKGSVVSNDPHVAPPAVFVDPARFDAWEAGGFLRGVKRDTPPGTSTLSDPPAVEPDARTFADPPSDELEYGGAMKEEPADG